MRAVIERLGSSVDDQGFIHHDERPSTYEAAEAIVGKRLDRRRNYAIMRHDGDEPEVCETISWTQTCSECNGGGCHECGHHGVVRNAQWVPVYMCDAARDVLKELHHADR